MWWLIPLFIFLGAIGNIVWVLNDRRKGFEDYYVPFEYSKMAMLLAFALFIGHFL